MESVSYDLLLAYFYNLIGETGRIKLMKILSILLNIGFILIFAGMWISAGELPDKPLELFKVAVIFATPIISLFVIINYSGSACQEAWLSLFIERKKLEEKNKLAKLKKENM